MISASIIADTISPLDGNRITTMDIEVPRFVWSEFMTHRSFSRNAASSRAIPVQQMIDRVRDNPAMPVHWGKNQPGMQAKEELDPVAKLEAQRVWIAAANDAANRAQQLIGLGIHKQVANRVLEPFVFMRAIVTFSTPEPKNFMNLRRHGDADPTLFALADNMLDAYQNSRPRVNEWHIPYGDQFPDLHLEDQIKIGVSCCAQVSYRKNDTSLEKAQKIFDMLLKAEVPHASPFEHIAVAKEGRHANFTGWQSYRNQLGW